MVGVRVVVVIIVDCTQNGLDMPSIMGNGIRSVAKPARMRRLRRTIMDKQMLRAVLLMVYIVISGLLFILDQMDYVRWFVWCGFTCIYSITIAEIGVDKPIKRIKDAVVKESK